MYSLEPSIYLLEIFYVQKISLFLFFICFFNFFSTSLLGKNKFKSVECLDQDLVGWIQINLLPQPLAWLLGFGANHSLLFFIQYTLTINFLLLFYDWLGKGSWTFTTLSWLFLLTANIEGMYYKQQAARRSAMGIATGGFPPNDYYTILQWDSIHRPLKPIFTEWNTWRINELSHHGWIAACITLC